MTTFILIAVILVIVSGENNQNQNFLENSKCCQLECAKMEEDYCPHRFIKEDTLCVTLQEGVHKGCGLINEGYSSLCTIKHFRPYPSWCVVCSGGWCKQYNYTLKKITENGENGGKITNFLLVFPGIVMYLTN